MKAVFLLLNRRLLRGSDRKNRGFFRFCCFCSLKRQQKLRVVQVFAVEPVNRAWDRGLDMSQRAAEAPEGTDAPESSKAPDNPDAPEGLEVLKVVGGEPASLGTPALILNKRRNKDRLSWYGKILSERNRVRLAR